MRTIQAMVLLAAGLLLSSCGGSNSTCYGGPGSTKCSSGTTSTTATALTIQLDKTSISNAGSDVVTATATAATAGGQTVSGVPVTFSVDNGAVFTASSTTTDASGIVTATVSIGSDKADRTITVAVTSGSLSASASFAVTGATLSSTASPAVVPPSSTGNKVAFLLQDAAGNAMAGQAIDIAAGPAGVASGVTDSNGAYTFTYTAPAATGTLSIAATAGGVQAVQDVQVQATSTVPPATVTPTSATVAANPSVVSPNVNASTNNQAAVIAQFRDAGNSVIPNIRVRFFVSGYGALSTGSSIVYSDANGRAITAFVPGSVPSPKDGVTITACFSLVDFNLCTDSGVTSITTTLTVASDPLSISIGTDNLIVIGDLTYTQRFVVTAVDIAGRAKANVQITPSIDLQYYFKGRYAYSGSQWAIVAPGPVGCQNEDIDRTGYYQASQDINQNGQIDPRKSDVVISPVSVTTDSSGMAILQIEYPKNVGSWLEYQILVSAGVNGTEGRATWTSVLGVPVTDITAAGAPAFVRSPYGVVTTTAVPSINFPPPAPVRGPVPPCENAD